jgi:agmatinase
MAKSYSKVDLSFQSCTATYAASKVVIFSVPLDTTTSFRPGTRFAGNAIRVDSIGIEWYSPYADKSLKDYPTSDIGDLELPMGDVEKSLSIIKKVTKDIVSANKLPIMIGGEHLASLPVLEVMHQQYPNLKVIHFDAHTDLRESFLGRKLSHATFLRHAHEFLGDGAIYQFGIRSGDKSEFEWAKQHTYLHKYDLDTLEEIIDKLKDEPVYVTLDLDVLDPSIFPGTGTPEPGGITYKELLNAISNLNKLNNIVGFDMMELAPDLDNSHVSTLVGAKTLREIVLLMHKFTSKDN